VLAEEEAGALGDPPVGGDDRQAGDGRVDRSPPAQVTSDLGEHWCGDYDPRSGPERR